MSTVQFGVGTVQRSFDDLGTPLADTTFCVLDLETTGGNREHDSITEVGVVKVRGGECLGTFQTLVNPGRAIPPRISVLTGLTDAVVAPAPRIEAVLPVAARVPRERGDRRPQRRLRSRLPAGRAAAGRPSPAPSAADRHRGARPPSRPRRGAGLPAVHARLAAAPRPPPHPPRPRRRPRHDRPPPPAHRAGIRARRARPRRPRDARLDRRSPAGGQAQAHLQPAPCSRRVPVLRPPRRGHLRRQGVQPAPAGAQLLRPGGPAPHRADAARGAEPAPPPPARRAVRRGRRGAADQPPAAALQPGRHARRPLLLHPPRRRRAVAPARGGARSRRLRPAPRTAAVADDGATGRGCAPGRAPPAPVLGPARPAPPAGRRRHAVHRRPARRGGLSVRRTRRPGRRTPRR